MSRPSLRKSTLPRRANGRRAIVVLLVIGALLALPATAGAHVDKAHKALYTSTVQRWTLYDREFEKTVSLDYETADMLTTQAATLIDSKATADVMALAYIQQTMAAIAEECQHGSLMPAIEKLSKESAGFYGKAAPWFATKSDRNVLRNGITLFHQGTLALAVEYSDIGMAAALVMQHPLSQKRIDLARANLDDAGRDGVKAVAAFPALDRLRSLE